MDWDLKEALRYYQNQGAPRDQSALTDLLREIQQKYNGRIPCHMPGVIADAYQIKETFLLAIISRLPSLRLENSHCLELCAGANCTKHAELAAYAEKCHADSGKKFILKFTPCMRMCGKGPNLKWDGVLYPHADQALLKKLLQDAGIDF